MNFYATIITFFLVSCILTPKRYVAQSEGNTIVSFYDASTCSQNHCDERKYNLNDSAERNALVNNLQILAEKSKNLKSENVSSNLMDESIQFNLGHKSIAKSASFAAKIAHNDEVNAASEKIRELFAALKNNFIPPIDSEFQLLSLPIALLKLSQYNTVWLNSRGEKYLMDPIASTFWIPKDLENLNYYAGFGRKKPANLSNIVCNYDKAKAGWGINPGFHAECGGQKYKVKLGQEVYSSSFNARIYWALGYNVPTIDFVETPVINYDRRLLTEFNSRKIENFKVKLGLAELKKIDHINYHSPFDYIKEVVLADNSTATSTELRKLLFLNPELAKPEQDLQNYNTEFESKIKKIVLMPASFLTKDDSIEVGAWKFSELGHENRRELKGLQMLAAWVGNFDMRMDNNRLIFDKNASGNSYKHALVDVGSGFGNSNFLPTKSSSDINAMPWKATQITDTTEQTQVVKQIQITGLIHIEANQAFKNMSLQDGQWMIAKLCAISDEQIKVTLIASGLTSAEARLAYEKLLTRRTQMVDDFQLSRELSQCLRSTNMSLSYVEDSDGPFDAKLQNGVRITARRGAYKIENGQLVK